LETTPSGVVKQRSLETTLNGSETAPNWNSAAVGGGLGEVDEVEHFAHA
jgi:hypothetical protein